MAQHLRDRHQASADLQRQVHQYVKHFRFTYNHATVPLPADGSAPQPIIRVVDGLACRACAFKSTSRPVMRMHANQTHSQKMVADEDLFRVVRW
jgi:hypothetical protein